jgi:hypothetical protein
MADVSSTLPPATASSKPAVSSAALVRLAEVIRDTGLAKGAYDDDDSIAHAFSAVQAEVTAAAAAAQECSSCQRTLIDERRKYTQLLVEMSRLQLEHAKESDPLQITLLEGENEGLVRKNSALETSLRAAKEIRIGYESRVRELTALNEDLEARLTVSIAEAEQAKRTAAARVEREAKTIADAMLETEAQRHRETVESMKKELHRVKQEARQRPDTTALAAELATVKEEAAETAQRLREEIMRLTFEASARRPVAVRAEELRALREENALLRNAAREETERFEGELLAVTEERDRLLRDASDVESRTATRLRSLEAQLQAALARPPDPVLPARVQELEAELARALGNEQSLRETILQMREAEAASQAVIANELGLAVTAMRQYVPLGETQRELEETRRELADAKLRLLYAQPFKVPAECTSAMFVTE